MVNIFSISANLSQKKSTYFFRRTSDRPPLETATDDEIPKNGNDFVAARSLPAQKERPLRIAHRMPPRQLRRAGNTNPGKRNKPKAAPSRAVPTDFPVRQSLGTRMHGNHRGSDVRPGSKIRTGKRFSARPTACTKTWSGNRPNIVYDGNGPLPGPDRNRISPLHKVDTRPAPFSHNEPARNDGMRPFPLVHEKAIAGQAASPRNVRKDSRRKKSPS